jgi:uncharacterized LabA/DUF88 family protein
MKKKDFELKLNGKTCVMIDWANVYGWTNNLKKEVDVNKLYEYLKRYSQIEKIRFYFGEDKTNEKSGKFLKVIKEIGYDQIRKEVKFIKIYDEEGKNYFLKRKCDFDLEIGLDTMEVIDKYQTFIFFSGDGDFKTLYERLLKKRKQIIVIFGRGSLGRELVGMKGVFLCDIEKNIPSVLKPRGVIRSIITKKKKHDN